MEGVEEEAVVFEEMIEEEEDFAEAVVCVKHFLHFNYDEYSAHVYDSSN